MKLNEGVRKSRARGRYFCFPEAIKIDAGEWGAIIHVENFLIEAIDFL